MVELGSNVVLTENILKQKFEFVRDLYQWSVDNRETIVKNLWSTGDTFTIPENKTFYITNMIVGWFGLTAPNVVIGDATAGAINKTNFLFNGEFGGEARGQITMAFPMPLKIESGNTISTAIITAGDTHFVTLIGYFEPKKI